MSKRAKQSVALEIIDINKILQTVGIRYLDKMGAHDGAVMNMALNRLSALSASAETMLQSEAERNRQIIEDNVGTDGA